MSRRVLVTGAARHLGTRVVRALLDDAEVEHVVGVDVVAPARDLGGARFVRGDIRTPIVSRLISEHRIDTVVHLGVLATPRTPSAARAAKEVNVVGTLQVLAACQRAEGVRRVVVRSSTAVYGAGPHDPGRFSESDEPTAPPTGGHARETAEVEDYVRGFVRRRPDVSVLVLRLANLVGPSIETPLLAHLSARVVPTVLGRDPRLQFLHEDDATAVFARAVTTTTSGTVNVAGDGVLMLSQVLRRARRCAMPVPGSLLPAASRLAGGATQLGRDDVAFLGYGRAVDTTRMRRDLGFEPAFTTASAVDAFLAERAGDPGRTGADPDGSSRVRALAVVPDVPGGRDA